MSRRLFYWGITQARVPLGIRERLRVEPAGAVALAEALHDIMPEAFVLSTCERFEVYAAGTVPAGPVVELLAGVFRFSTEALDRHLHVRQGDEVARHLLRVAAGLESRMLGEHQVLGQVRSAYVASLDAGTCGPLLAALGRAAIRAGRRVRQATPLGSQAASTAALAVERVATTDVPLTAQAVMLLGTGRLAEDVGRTLTRRRVGRLCVASRCLARAQALARRYDAEAVDFAQLGKTLAEMDGLIACSAGSFLVNRTLLAGRNARRLRIVDLGVPRNVDPDIGPLPGVSLTHLEELHAFRARPAEAIASADAIVAQELDRFLTWQRGRAVAADVAALVAGAEDAGGLDGPALHAAIARLKQQVAA